MAGTLAAAVPGRNGPQVAFLQRMRHDEPMPENDDAKPADGTGMDRQAMKKMLALSRRAALNAAIGMGDPKDGSLGLLLIDKVMPPKQILKTLKDQFPKGSKFCFGTASVDMDADPKLVKFRMNKRIPGLDRRLRKTLKGTGYSKVAIETGGGEAP
jgi:hypothetical protein